MVRSATSIAFTSCETSITGSPMLSSAGNFIEVESVDPPTEIKTYESKRASDTSGTNH